MFCYTTFFPVCAVCAVYTQGRQPRHTLCVPNLDRRHPIKSKYHTYKY
nr:MAG TPA: hypothetical protein [Caudoviricetes sp.]